MNLASISAIGFRARGGLRTEGRRSKRVDSDVGTGCKPLQPNYTQRGIELARIFPGSTDTTTFEDFIDQLRYHCDRWPEPESVLVIDNASIYYAERVRQLYKEASVKLIPLAPYSSDTNPIEEFFAEVKDCVKSGWDKYIGVIRKDFRAYVRSYVEIVSSR